MQRVETDHTSRLHWHSTRPWLIGSLSCLVLAMILPLLGVGAAWPKGYIAMVLAAWNCLALGLAPRDPLILAGAWATAANFALALSLLGALVKLHRRRAGRVIMIFLACIGLAMAMGAIGLLASAHLLTGIGAGAPLWLGAFVMIGIGVGRSTMRSSGHSTE